MRSKTIKSILQKKVNDFLDSIQDETLKKLLKNNVIITGGSIVSMLLNEKPNDFDIYFRTKEAAKAAAEYYANMFNELNKGKENKVGRPLHAWVLDGEDVQEWKDGKKRLTEFAWGYENDHVTPSGMVSNTPPDRIKVMINSDGIAEEEPEKEMDVDKYIELVSDADEIEDVHLEEGEDKPKYRPIFLSTNAITLSDKVQLVIRFYGEPEEIHKNYDFVHCTCYWTSWDNNLVLPVAALEAILNKDLHYIGSKYPICSVIRTKKFIKRGWKINAGQYLKMAFQISELDLKDIYVLEDQLVGVDSLYFLAAIQTLRKKQEEEPGFTFDNTYLASVIDKIF